MQIYRDTDKLENKALRLEKKYITALIEAYGWEHSCNHLSHIAWDIRCENKVTNRKPKRDKPSTSTIIKVRIRDGNKCLKCGSDKYLHMDHIIPVVDGGRAVFDNLQTLCRRCNSSKGIKQKDYRKQQ